MTTGTPEVTQAEDAFWAKVDVRGDAECWPWLGGKHPQGYGRAHSNGRMRPAAQIAWELSNGTAFPAGKLACHTCDNPPCVNPAHIWPGTQSENLKDCVAKGRHRSIPQAHCQRGHEMSGGNRVPATGGFRCRACERDNTRERTRRYRARLKGQA